MKCHSGQTGEKAEVRCVRYACSTFAVGLHIDTILQSTSHFPAIHRKKIWCGQENPDLDPGKSTSLDTARDMSWLMP